MNDKIKNIVVTAVFCIMIFGIFIINLVKAPSNISISERRPLKQMPALSFETVFKPTKENPAFMSEFEKYVLDTPYGKVPLNPTYALGRYGNYYVMKTYDDKIWKEYNPLY